MARVAVWILSLTFASAGLASAAAAQDLPGRCDLQPWLPMCDGGGGTDPGDPESVEGDMVWGAYDQLTSVCPGTPPRPQYLQRLVWATGPNAGTHVHTSDVPGSFGPGDPVPNGPVGAVFAADGYVYRWVCSDPSVAEDVWEEARELMLPIENREEPARDRPDRSRNVGVVLRPDHRRAVPGRLDRSSDKCRLDSGSESVDRHSPMGEMGDGEIITAAATVFAEGAEGGGTEANPAGTHTYRTTSAQFGFVDGYPFTFEATWVGEFRW